MKEHEYTEFITDIIKNMCQKYNEGSYDLLGYYDGFYDAKMSILNKISHEPVETVRKVLDTNVYKEDPDTDYWDGFYDTCIIITQNLGYRFPYGEIDMSHEKDDNREEII